MTNVMELRKRKKENSLNEHDVKLGFMSFFTKAVVAALKNIHMLMLKLLVTKFIKTISMILVLQYLLKKV